MRQSCPRHVPDCVAGFDSLKILHRVRLDFVLQREYCLLFAFLPDGTGLKFHRSTGGDGRGEDVFCAILDLLRNGGKGATEHIRIESNLILPSAGIAHEVALSAGRS